VLVAAAATAAILGVLVVWLIHSNAPSLASAALLPARAADISTIDERVGRASDALVMPTSAPAPPPHPDPALLAETAPVAQPPAQTVIQQEPPAATAELRPAAPRPSIK
jgi:hypothetical protein